MTRRLAIVVLSLVLGGEALGAASGPIQLAPAGDAVWVVNPDSGSVAHIDPANNTRIEEIAVGANPRTLAVTSSGVYVTNQDDDTVQRVGDPAMALPFGCRPYGIVANAAGDALYVSCQGSSTVVVLNPGLGVTRTVALAWPEPRGLAVAPDGKLYVSHFVTKEPNDDGHVSEVDPTAGTVTRVFAIPPDFSTCETTASGQGVANLLDAMAVAPPGAPAAVAGQLWVGGTIHNVLRKGLFERSRYFASDPAITARTGIFPKLDFQSNPAGEGDNGHRNIYKPAFHDIARAAVWKIDLASGESRGRLDVDNGGQISGLAFSSDGATAYAVDQMANGFYAFSVARGANGNPASLFGRVARKGPGGAAPSTPCGWQADETDPEDAYLLAPQARLVPSGGMNPLDATALTPVATGLDYAIGLATMVDVPDGAGTTPIGLVLGPGGTQAYVADYLARKVVVVAATPAGFRCQDAPAQSCTTRASCASECMPLVAAVVRSTAGDPVLAEILDGKILFSTSARQAKGARGAIPPWNALTTDGTKVQGEVVSTARDGGSMACTSCHPDFGGQDGRTWDFSQFGASLRNTMDLRGRAAFAPGTCSHDARVACTTDAQCMAAGGAASSCRADPNFVPPNIGDDPAVHANYFNPMGSTHWNGDRDEVEDFEFTLRELLGASDCDGNEHSPETCVGALFIRRFIMGLSPNEDIVADLSPEPNRHRSARLDHLGDYVYSLTSFPRNPNLGAGGTAPSASAARGRLLFNDPVVHCSFCHNSPPPSPQQFSDKKPATDYDPNQTPQADLNNPFFVHDVNTTNVFDETNPLLIASDVDGLLGYKLFQNEQNAIPGNRSRLNAYITSVLNDAWNTAPYLHDGTAPTLLDVVRACLPRFGNCEVAGKGRNVDDLHGVTSFLSARQLNDLAAFEEAAHGPIGETGAVRGTALAIKRLRVKFGKAAGADKLALVATATVSGAQTFDPTAGDVVVSLGVPQGSRMTVVEWSFPQGTLTGKNGRFRAKGGPGAQNGLRVASLVVKRGKLVLTVAARTDLAAFRGGTSDWTIAVEVGSDVAGTTRPFATKRKGTLVVGP